MCAKRRIPWYAWLLIGALPGAGAIGLVLQLETLFLAAMALMPLVAPLSLFYWMRTDEHEGGDNVDTGG